jgi:hypothetical protein
MAPKDSRQLPLITTAPKRSGRQAVQKLTATLAVVVLLSAGAPLAMAQYGNNGYGNNGNLPPLQGRVVTAPAGTFMSATVNTPLSSEFARVGDRFTAVLGGDVAAGGSVVLPSGSQLEGQVVSVERAGRAGKNGYLDVRFTGATLPNGQRVALSAKIQTQDGTGLIRGGTTKGRVGKAALRTGVGAGLGAALGTAMGPLSGGEVGRGAIYGTALGGGMGLASAAWAKGEEAVLPAGQPVNITLDQPLTTNDSGGGYGGGGYNQGGYGGYNQQPQQNYGGQSNSVPYYHGQGQNQGYNPYGGQSQPSYGGQTQY